MSSKQKNKYELVVVDWVDAWGNSGWKSQPRSDEIVYGAPVRSVGFLIQSTKEGVTLTSGIMPEDDPDIQNPLVLSMNFIPRGMIKSIKKIK